MDSLFLANAMCCMDLYQQQQIDMMNAEMVMNQSYLKPKEFLKPATQDYSYYKPIFRPADRPAIYFSEIPKEDKCFSKEIYDCCGKMEAKIKMKEKKNHVFIMSCSADESKLDNNKDIILDMILSLLDNIYEDTPYIVAEVHHGEKLFDEVLKKIGFKEIKNEAYKNRVYILN